MKLEKRFDIDYYSYSHSTEPERTATRKWTHKYTETWVITMLYCPNCGEREVWQEQGGGDYYVGEKFACTACRHIFNLPCNRVAADDSDLQRIAKLIG